VTQELVAGVRGCNYPTRLEDFMRAVIARKGKLIVDEMATPEPGPGEVLVRTLVCGICGSDLHADQHTEEFISWYSGGGYGV
jgi:hypothetical protein